MFFINWITAFLCLFSFVIFASAAITSLIDKKNINAIANFAYSITTLVAGILILVTKSTEFMMYYMIAFSFAWGIMAYKDYKEGNYKTVIMESIIAFVALISFNFSCFLSIIP